MPAKTKQQKRTAAHVPQGSVRRGIITQHLVHALRLLAQGRHQIEDLGDAIGLERRSAYRLVAGLKAGGLRIEHQREGAKVFLRASREEVEDWIWRRPIGAPEPTR